MPKTKPILKEDKECELGNPIALSRRAACWVWPLQKLSKPELKAMKLWVWASDLLTHSPGPTLSSLALRAGMDQVLLPTTGLVIVTVTPVCVCVWRCPLESWEHYGVRGLLEILVVCPVGCNGAGRSGIFPRLIHVWDAGNWGLSPPVQTLFSWDSQTIPVLFTMVTPQDRMTELGYSIHLPVLLDATLSQQHSHLHFR